jgi:hypothetical protein
LTHGREIHVSSIATLHCRRVKCALLSCSRSCSVSIPPSRRCCGSVTDKVGLRNDEGWLCCDHGSETERLDWTGHLRPLINLNPSRLDGSSCCKLSIFLHANALFHLLGLALQARWINIASMHLPMADSTPPSPSVERCDCRNFTQHHQTCTRPRRHHAA